jgi:Trk K+ transport system NAD-binding subunit
MSAPVKIGLIGLGEVGKYLLNVLQHEGHDVVAVDRDPEAVAYAEEHFDVASIVEQLRADRERLHAAAARERARLSAPRVEFQTMAVEP